MTFSEFLTTCCYVAPFERRGQAAFNRLWSIRPDIANPLRGGPIDPFNDDSRIGHFWAFVEAHWNDKEDE